MKPTQMQFIYNLKIHYTAIVFYSWALPFWVWSGLWKIDFTLSFIPLRRFIISLNWL